MLLCTIVELVSGDLNSAEVEKLGDLIKQYNQSQAKLLGAAWLTFNNHNVTHLPYFIKHFGSPQHFSLLPFERVNGVMGTIPTSGHKGGVLEATIMHNAAQQNKLQRLLAASGEPFFESKLLESIKGHHPLDLSELNTFKKKKALNDSTFRLLLEHLNRRTTASSSVTTTTSVATTSSTGQFPRHTPYWDTNSPSSVARLDKQVIFIQTTVMDQTPNTVKVGGIGQGGRNNRQNCWCLVMISGVPRPARILWLFSKAIRTSATSLDVVSWTFMHVQLLEELSLDVLGRHHPSRMLLRSMGIRLAKDLSEGEHNSSNEVVIDSEAFVQQLAVVPFVVCGQHLLGLKPL